MRTSVLLVARSVLLAAVLLSQALPLGAQGGRDALRQGSEAYDGAEFQRAIELLSSGLDPSEGPQDSLWRASVHMLADALIEQGAASLANVWLRWALRIDPRMNADSINFPPVVTNAFVAARSAVASAGVASEVALVTWEWSKGAGSGTQGSIRLQATLVRPIVEVRGAGTLTTGEQQRLSAGTYVLTATAADHLPAEITVEVLPGVTTVLSFDLEPSTGLLYVVSRPWGEVYLDGESIGRTIVAAREIDAGEHRVQILRDGYVPFDTTITVHGDQPFRIGSVRLERERRR